MADSGNDSDGSFGNLEALFAAVEAQRRRIRKSAEAALKRLESQRDAELAQLDSVEAVLSGSRDAATPARSRSVKKRKGPRGQAKTAKEEARERSEAAFIYLVEQGQRCLTAQIRADLGFTPHEATTAMNRLLKEKRVVRTGSGRWTGYEIKGGGPASRHLSAVPPPNPTLRGRILEVLLDRGSASLDELVQATGASRERVLKECGALLVEEEIRMGQRNGRPVYIAQLAA